MRKFLSFITLVICILVNYHYAHALKIYQYDGTDWILYDPSGAWTYTSDPAGASDTLVIDKGGGEYAVLLATNDWGKPENGSQTQAIYGAGVLLPSAVGYRVDFTTELYTWDSYNKNIGPETGYWDVFAVNFNQDGFYWDIVGTYGDPIISPDPDGSVVQSGPGGTGATSLIPGETWAWGGMNYSGGGFESEVNPLGYSLYIYGDPTMDYYLSVVLDTKTLPDSDTRYPSYGAFNYDGVPPPAVPEPATLLLLGCGMLGIYFNKRR